MNFPWDITRNTVDGLLNSSRLLALKYASGGDGRLASGRLRVLTPTDTMTVAIGRMNGQRGYDAVTSGEPGLNIELRLRGKSFVEMMSDTENEVVETELEPLQMQIIAHDQERKWHIIAPPQPVFEAVSVKFKPQHFDQIADSAPEISRWAKAAIANRYQIIVPLPVELASIANRMLELPTEDAGLNLLLEAFANQILVAAWKNVARPAPQATPGLEEEELVSYALELIRANPSANLTINDLANACRVSPSRLKAMFQRVHGTSIGTEIITIRMALAIELLQSGVPISQAAYSLGYKTPAAFSKAVKQHYGVPPKQLSARG